MKWHVMCLVTVLLMSVGPIEFASSLMAIDVSYSSMGVVTVSSFYQSTSRLWAHWQAMVWAYGAWPRKLSWRQYSSLFRRKQRNRKRRPAVLGFRSSTLSAVSGKAGFQTVTVPKPSNVPRSTTKKNTRIPLRLVLSPGVILTKRGMQLRPVIARLGSDVSEYRTLWKDPAQFKAAIQPELHRPCPLCGGRNGFRCIGSDRRSVIPPGSKDRAWFRIQKIECRACQADTRILPTFCIPFKSHHAQTIQNAVMAKKHVRSIICRYPDSLRPIES